MGQRSRKRGRRARPASGPAARSASPSAARPERARPPASPQPGVSRSEERNAAIRASLTPFAVGERPWAIRISVLIAVLLAGANLVLFISGARPHVGGQQPRLAEILVFSGLMLMCAAGMWLMRYWAVLGFQTLLAIGVLGFCLALVRVSSAFWAGVCVAVILGGGYLFFKLVRVLSRLQLPRPPGS